jgi:hypothetical protein
LKQLLINKFRTKYVADAQMQRFIENEITRFLANDRLTEANLKKLDAKIAAEVSKKERQSKVLDDRKSQRSHSSQVSQKSIRSVKSKGGLSAADLAKLEKNPVTKVESAKSMRSKSVYSEKAPTEVFTEINENDEWTAIQKFNTLLYFEE